MCVYDKYINAHLAWLRWVRMYVYKDKSRYMVKSFRVEETDTAQSYNFGNGIYEFLGCSGTPAILKGSRGGGCMVLAAEAFHCGTATNLLAHLPPL